MAIVVDATNKVVTSLDDLPTKYLGLSTDAKPTVASHAGLPSPAAGSEFRETDTGDTYFTANGTDWVKGIESSGGSGLSAAQTAAAILDATTSDHATAGTVCKKIIDIPTTAMRGTDNAALASVLGALNSAAASGAVGDTTVAMGYIKQAVTLLLAIPTTAMRGTDNAALASVVGALNNAAADGAVTDVDTMMAYVKQLVTLLLLVPTTAMRGTDNAALASVLGALNDAAATGAVSDVKTVMGYIKQLVTAILLIPTTAMRGTDNAALASVLGALDAVAATGAVSDAKVAMAYIKQLVTGLIALTTTVGTPLTSGDVQGADAAAIAAAYGNANARVVTKTSAGPHLTSGNIFNIAGSVQILAVIGRISSAIENSAQTVKLSITNDSLTAVDICAATTITNFAVKSLLWLTGIFTDVLSGGGATAVNVVAANPSPIIVSTTLSGVIATTFGTSGSLDGAIVWEILWIPLNAAGAVTPA